MNLEQFTQTNLAGVLDRANEILKAIRTLGLPRDSDESIVTEMMNKLEAGDDWERAAVSLVAVEMMECRIRAEDPNVEKFPAGWAGGVAQQFVTTQPAQPEPDDVCPNCEYSAVRCECTPKLPHAPKLFGGNNLEKLSPQLLTNMLDHAISRKEAGNETQARAYLRNISSLTFMQLYCDFAVVHTTAHNDMQQILDACKT